MTTFEKLYANWADKLSALYEENQKHDFSPEGEARYDVAFAEAKQAYWLLCEAPAQAVQNAAN